MHPNIISMAKNLGEMILFNETLMYGEDKC